MAHIHQATPYGARFGGEVGEPKGKLKLQRMEQTDRGENPDQRRVQVEEDGNRKTKIEDVQIGQDET